MTRKEALKAIKESRAWLEGQGKSGYLTDEALEHVTNAGLEKYLKKLTVEIWRLL